MAKQMTFGDMLWQTFALTITYLAAVRITNSISHTNHARMPAFFHLCHHFHYSYFFFEIWHPEKLTCFDIQFSRFWYCCLLWLNNTGVRIQSRVLDIQSFCSAESAQIFQNHITSVFVSLSHFGIVIKIYCQNPNSTTIP